ncbi:superoxide dismutase [Falsibacillus albus]|uniref:superoxide dismutase n=1 Tax=Falsibacillus albus TaxID=2478915 RepID=A0A3L7JWB6_9BACI|nr:superoxide dismutase [Falsibacillus albus]RLQ95046.1 superoxide dismutase [Falsibacillus albus]
MQKGSSYSDRLYLWIEGLEKWTKEQLEGDDEFSRRSSELKRAILTGVGYKPERFYDEAFQLYQDILDRKQGRSKNDEGYIWVEEIQVPIGQHKLPPLPYPYNGLEPYISEEIMKLHHDKHHQAYVDGLNKAEKALESAREKNDFGLIKHWERELAFNGSGHYLHTIFWENMKPNGGGVPPKELLDALIRSFGSFDSFKRQFSEAAKQVEGSGWAILVWSPRTRRLEILQSEKHMNLTQWDTIPLLVLDVWEHAYYLQYKNKRRDYVDQWWNIVDWKDVEKRFGKAKKIKWQPY